MCRTASVAVGFLMVLVGPGTAVGAEVSPSGYTPPVGVTTSDPSGPPAQRNAIAGMLVRTLDNTPAGAQVRVASWNIRSDNAVDALIRAHKRGVGVRVVADIGNDNARNPNDTMDRLRRALERHNAERPPATRSGLRLCVGSCRALGGIPHTKFFLFSRVGKAQRVVVNTSANATDVAVTSQWNDAIVMRNKKPLYRTFRHVFSQMWRDQPVVDPYTVEREGRVTALFFPFSGVNALRDPVLRDLQRVSCVGALDARGGRTRIRIAISAWHGSRGVAIATRIRELADAGCNIRIVYAVAGPQVLRILASPAGAGPIPTQHIVQDLDRDGIYDRYLHSKVLTIKGVYAGDPSAAVTISGSANWTALALLSDEAMVQVRSKRILKAYNHYIDGLYKTPPPQLVGRTRTVDPRLADNAPPVDPYAKVEE